MQTYRRMEAYNQLHAAESTLPHLVENSSHFMEAKVSLPHLQAPITCPHTQPDQSSPCPSFYFLQIHSNIILSSTPGSTKRSLPSDFPIKTLYAPLLSLHTYHITHLLHGPWFDYPNNIWWVHALSSLLCSPPHSPVILYLLGLKIFLSLLFSNTLSLCYSTALQVGKSRVRFPTGQLWFLLT